MHIFMIVAHPGIHGPIPKLNFLMATGLKKLGADICEAPYCKRLPTQAKDEPFLRKIIGRVDDLRALVAGVRVARPDLIFAAQTTQDRNSLLRDFPLAVISHFLRIPMVLLFHGSRAQELDTNGELRFVTRLFLSLTNGILVLSEEEVPFFRKYWPNYPFACVPYPAVTTMAQSSGFPNSYPAHWKDESLPILLFTGRLVPPKGIQELIEAMQIVLQKIKCRLVVLGEGELFEPMKARVREMKIGTFVHFTGYLEDQNELQAWFQASDVFVLPTYWREGFPVVIMEAMANGLPIVCTKIRGAADYLKEGVHALFIPPRDPTTLAAKLTKLLEDESGRAHMSQANLALIQQFEPETVMKKYLDFFERIL